MERGSANAAEIVQFIILPAPPRIATSFFFLQQLISSMLKEI